MRYSSAMLRSDTLLSWCPSAFARALLLGCLMAPTAVLATPPAPAAESPTPAPRPLSLGLTAVDGVLVGHHRLADRATGCTVVRVDAGAVAAVDVAGGAPGTRETDLLDPARTVQQAHAIVLAGGSAFGLAAADGVMEWLAARGVGFPTGGGPVPIVPAAILYDLQVVAGAADPQAHPGADCGRRAAAAASDGPVVEGTVGAGTGATVGKLAGFERATKSGLGSAAVRTTDGFTVAALAAVNALGDIVDPSTGQLVAGARSEDGRRFVDARRLLRGEVDDEPTAATEGLGAPPSSNTTLVIVATDAVLDQASATRLARMAQAGLARTIYPVYTPWDGDVVFALATARRAGEVDLVALGARAADAVAEAVLRAARTAESLPGLPSARELEAATDADSPTAGSAP
ncbi:MAG: P1 family peptidase [Acidobacteriota bacterium]